MDLLFCAAVAAPLKSVTTEKSTIHTHRGAVETTIWLANRRNFALQFQLCILRQRAEIGLIVPPRSNLLFIHRQKQP